MPAAKAGAISKPQGRIAFIRDGNIWAMDATGANQQVICEVTNADGRLTWSPDGKTIMFTRSGKVTFQAPDFSGGVFKVYDIFLASLDSAFQNKPLFWQRLTDDMGSRDPEWSADGKTVIFTKDMHANRVNAYEPNYQICTMDPNGSNVRPFRKDWEGLTEYLIAPSMNANGDIACVSLVLQKMMGLVAVPKSAMTAPMDSLQSLARMNPSCVGPCWSPDGKWLAYINNDLNDGGLYIATADLSEKYVVFDPPPATNMHTVAPSFSPDSKWLTFSTTDGSIYISDITGADTRRLTGPGSDKFPAWSKTP
ncbi:MAG TPA: hypothetical protein VN285_02305 [Candidatus Deferrimicrobium sp.]|nr:hypothetical protein [Candidatus Deferrimicrobium sp.]